MIPIKKALGLIETKGLIGSIEALDAMVKAADVQLVNQEKVEGALVAVMVEGDVSAVQAAVDAGREAAQRVGELIASHVIPHPDPSVKDVLKHSKSTRVTQQGEDQAGQTAEESAPSKKETKQIAKEPSPEQGENKGSGRKKKDSSEEPKDENS